MKNICVFLLFFLHFFAFGQSVMFSKYEKYDFENKEGKYENMLKTECRNQIMIKLNEHHFLTFSENDAYRYVVDESENVVISKRKLSEKETILLSKSLDTLKGIDPILLNSTMDLNGSEIIIEDGTTFQLEIFKNKSWINFITVAPETYIKNKFGNYKHKLSFVNVFNSLNNFFYDEEIEKIKNADTIYIVFDKNKRYDNLNIKINSFKNNDEYVIKFSDSKSLILNTYKNNKNKNMLNEKSVEINLEFINKHRFNKTLEILTSKKAIFILDKSENKIKAKKAYLLNTF